MLPLTPPEKIEELESYIRTVKVGARMLRSQYGEVPLPLILDVALTDAAAYQEYDSEEQKPEHHEHHEHHHHEHHHHSEHLQNDGFVSVSFESDRPFAVKKFETFLTEEVSTAVFRAKGILWFQESEARHVFQLSGPRYDLNQEDWLEPPKTQLVLIGRNLDPVKLKAQLTACLV